ncbi:factor activating pos9 [Didymella pomorum]
MVYLSRGTQNTPGPKTQELMQLFSDYTAFQSVLLDPHRCNTPISIKKDLKEEMARKNPNIIITGTPGVGKTTHAEQLAQATGLKHVSVNQIVKDEGFHEGKDEETGSWIVDEDKLLDYLEERNISEEGGSILDWHACDLFPERWIDLVVVLRCDSTVLYDRLTARGYKDKKLDENMDSEIMQVLLDEAREAYKEEIVVELRSDSADDVEGNLERIEQWIENWKKDHGGEE